MEPPDLFISFFSDPGELTLLITSLILDLHINYLGTFTKTLPICAFKSHILTLVFFDVWVIFHDLMRSAGGNTFFYSEIELIAWSLYLYPDFALTFSGDDANTDSLIP